jgi:GH25 family lysozyme M1 (1,4-beta-N-acetylmuramidase)
MESRQMIIQSVMQVLKSKVDQETLDIVQDALTIELNRYEVQERTTELSVVDNSAVGMLRRYIATKRIEGKAEFTLKRYWEQNLQLICQESEQHHKALIFAQICAGAMPRKDKNMELKGIDVSSWQGKPDWPKVSNSGVKFAILRIHQKSGTDASFEHNYKGCKSNGILIGGYKYSYALTPAQAIDEAENLISVLGGRGLDFPVFYDLEWSQQRSLGKQAIENIAVAFLTRIKKAGYKVGIYCNLDWYNNVLTDALKQYDCWIARYPASDNGSVQERLRPNAGVGWQYSSKGKVPGISGNVDMDVFYKDYRDSNQKGETKMVKISNCGHDERGRYAGGKAGDQTGTEYQIMNWYSRPWLCVLRFNDTKIATMIADMATKAAQNNLIGYDQGTAGNSNDRYSFWRHLKASNYDPAQITVACESDCSASTAAIVKGAGYRLNNARLKAVSIYLTTRNMRAAMKIAGAKVLTDRKYLTSGDYLKAGDILLNDNHHVAIAVTTGVKASTLSTPTILSKTPKWVGKVTANKLNVRTWAGTENPQLKSYPVLAKGNLVDVCDTIKAKDKTDWYYIRIAGKYFGFASAKYICKV